MTREVSSSLLDFPLGRVWRGPEEGWVSGWSVVEEVDGIVLEGRGSQRVQSSHISQFYLKEDKLFPFTLVATIPQSLK